MIYKREEIIKRGHRAHAARKVGLRIPGMILSILGVLIIIGLIVKPPASGEFISSLIADILFIFAPGSILVFLSFLKTPYDPLLVGCLDIEKEKRRQVAKNNRHNKKVAARKAKRKAQRAGRTTYTYTWHAQTTTFSGKKLYEYLKANETVEYDNLLDCYRTNKKLISKDRYSNDRKDNQHFDDVLSDEEFDDLMD